MHYIGSEAMTSLPLNNSFNCLSLKIFIANSPSYVAAFFFTSIQCVIISKYNKLLRFTHQEVIIQNLERVLHQLSFCALALQLQLLLQAPDFEYTERYRHQHSTMNDTQSLHSNYRDTFSRYIFTYTCVLQTPSASCWCVGFTI